MGSAIILTDTPLQATTHGESVAAPKMRGHATGERAAVSTR